MSTDRASTSPPPSSWTARTGPRLSKPVDVAGQHHLGAEPGRLRHGPAGQVGAGEALGEAQVVLDRRALVPAWPPGASRSTSTVLRPSEAA